MIFSRAACQELDSDRGGQTPRRVPAVSRHDGRGQRDRYEPALRAAKLYASRDARSPFAARTHHTTRCGKVARDLAGLGYRDWPTASRGWTRKNPGEVLSLPSQDDIDPRLVEGLPWLALRYALLTGAGWCGGQDARPSKSPRFVVGMAGPGSVSATSARPGAGDLESQLERSLAREDKICEHRCRRPSAAAREHRPSRQDWNLLTDWAVDALATSPELRNPWRAFLVDVTENLTLSVELHCWADSWPPVLDLPARPRSRYVEVVPQDARRRCRRLPSRVSASPKTSCPFSARRHGEPAESYAETSDRALAARFGACGCSRSTPRLACQADRKARSTAGRRAVGETVPSTRASSERLFHELRRSSR